MILVVKKWAQHNEINDASKGTLSSYALVLMVLHYLQSQYNHTQERHVLPLGPLAYHDFHVLFSLQLSKNQSFPLYRRITQ